MIERLGNGASQEQWKNKGTQDTKADDQKIGNKRKHRSTAEGNRLSGSVCCPWTKIPTADTKLQQKRSNHRNRKRKQLTSSTIRKRANSSEDKHNEAKY